jgi:hypothetical protein
MDIISLESCHSTWIFDVSRMRFCRILKNIEVSQRRVTTEWRPYAYLEIDPDRETFSVYLKADRSRVVRSSRHTADCVQCGSHPTAELSLDDIRHLIPT